MTMKDMLGRSGVVSREAALKTLDGQLVIPSLPSEDIPLSSSLGREVTAEEVLAHSGEGGFLRMAQRFAGDERVVRGGKLPVERDQIRAQEARQPEVAGVVGRQILLHSARSSQARRARPLC